MDNVQRLDPRRPWGELSLVLMDDEGIASLNAKYFGKTGPTDVISFRYDPLPGEAGVYSGEVVVNLQQAHAEGLARGAVDHELALYVAHGCHHLAGATDDTPARRARMLEVEEEWLREAGGELLALGLVRGNPDS